MISTFLESQNGHSPSLAAPAPISPPIAPDTPIPSLSDLFASPQSEVAPGATEANGGDVASYDSIAGWIEKSMGDYVEKQQTGGRAILAPETVSTTAAPAVKPVTISGETDPLMGQGIEISVEIYVEILEAVVSSLASWYAGDDNAEFNFEKKLKARYLKVAELYAKSQNVQVSPGFLFGAFTLVLIGQVGIKAHRRKQEIVKSQAFRKSVIKAQATSANSKGQMSLFPDRDMGQEKQVVIQPDGKGITIPEGERMRADFSVDEKGYYTKTARGLYISKRDRQVKPSADLWAFMQDYYNIHLSFPKNKEVKTFIRSL